MIGNDKLTSLSLESNNIDDEGASYLSLMTNLTYLNISCNKIGDAGAQYLSRLTNLTYLDLCVNKIGDAGTESLSRLHNLKYLDLSANDYGDEGAKFLPQLINLSYLDVSLTKITDAGTAYLAEMKYLTELDCSNNPTITPEAYNYLNARREDNRHNYFCEIFALISDCYASKLDGYISALIIKYLPYGDTFDQERIINTQNTNIIPRRINLNLFPVEQDNNSSSTGIDESFIDELSNSLTGLSWS